MSVEQGKVWVLSLLQSWIVKQLETPLPETQGVHLTSYTAQKEAVKRKNTWKATSKK